MKRFLLFFAFIFCANFSNAQVSDSWLLLKEEANIQIFYEIVPCESGQNIDPIELVEQGDLRHETFKLKIINKNTICRINICPKNQLPPILIIR